MTEAPPLLLLVGPSGHGVTQYGADVAAAARRIDPRTIAIAVGSLDDAPIAGRTHVHMTDRLIGRSPEEAAGSVERLAARTQLTLTAHDLPQDSDGAMRDRRISAYARLFAAAARVAVNSGHEQLLVREYLPEADIPHALTLGARLAAVLAHGPTPVAPAGTRDLVVLIAGYVYPGKGHAAAIVAAAAAADSLRAAGEPIAGAVVRAIGGSSAGHEGDLERLRADADARGVRFEVTGFLDDEAFSRALVADGIPLAAHEHVSASRSMLDWVEAGRRPLVVDSRYAAEMDQLRPGTLVRYLPGQLAKRLIDGWRRPEGTRLAAGTNLRPSLDDVAREYLAWWADAP